MADKVGQLRTRAGYPFGSVMPLPKDWPLRIPALQHPSSPDKLLSTIDPFPGYYSRSNFLFEPIREAFLGPGRPMHGGLEQMKHTKTRNFVSRFAAIVNVATRGTREEATIRVAAGDLLTASRFATQYEPDATKWMAMRPGERGQCVPLPLLAYFPSLRKKVTKRLGMYPRHVYA
jgi:hypothetical protein